MIVYLILLFISTPCTFSYLIAFIHILTESFEIKKTITCPKRSGQAIALSTFYVIAKPTDVTLNPTHPS